MPTVQSIHILAISVVIASAILLNLRLLGSGQDVPTAAYVRRYGPWLGGAILVLLLSGITLIVGEPSRTMENWVFWTKMGLVGTGAILTAAFALPVVGNAVYWDFGPRRILAKVLTTLSLLVWIGVVVCGRWIAYVL